MAICSMAPDNESYHLRTINRDFKTIFMKIAVIAKTRLKIAEPFRGGLEAFTYTLCKEYIRLGHDVRLYAHSESDPSLNVVGFYGSEHRDEPNFELYENDEYVSILRDIEHGDFDVVHNNSTHELPILWGRTASIPVVTTIHTPPISKLKATISLASDSENLKFVTISQSFDATWRPYTNGNSTVIYNGVDIDKWPLVRETKDYLLWYGRMVPAKGIDIALDTAHELGMPLHFAGSIDDEAYYTEQIKPRMSEGDTYAGHLSQTELLGEMRSASVLINGARWNEPFGLTNIEAMAAGVPVAGFDRGAFREIVDASSGVVAERPTIASLADAVRLAMALDGRDVRKRAEHFSLEKMADQYITVFEDLR